MKKLFLSIPGVTAGFVAGVLFLISCGGDGGSSTDPDVVNSANAVSVIDTITFVQYLDTQTGGVASLACPTGSVGVDSSCLCQYVGGVLFGSALDPTDGAVCGCTPDDVNTADDIVLVGVTCASSTEVDVVAAKASANTDSALYIQFKETQNSFIQ